MQKFEILYNIAFSANTNLNSLLTLDSNEPVLYDTQQNINLNQEYFSYTPQVGVSLVNDLNVKAFLDKPENEKIALEFINYIKSLLTIEEFRDLFYDNKKLAEFFNDYYRKYINYSNQGQSTDIENTDINLIDTKNSLFNADEKYLKTNSLTNYFTNRVLPNGNFLPNNYPNATRPSDFINFTGDSENYYLNITINKKSALLSFEDFSQYFKDTCDGNINVTRYLYRNNFNSQPLYGNIDEIIRLQQSSNSNFGPNTNSIKYLESLLPVNFLRMQNQSNNSISQSQNNTAQIVLEDGIYFSSPAQVINIPQPSNDNQIQNFRGFNVFKQYFNWNYRSYSPNFNSVQDINQNYIYQSVIDLSAQINTLIDSSNPNLSLSIRQSRSMSMGSNNNSNVPNLTRCEFEFVQDQNWYNLDYIGQIYDPLNTNQLSISIKHNFPNKRDKVILNYEYFSPSLLGPDDGISAFNLANPNNDVLDPTYELQFDIGDTVKTININIYKNWGVRSPIVLSLRPFNNPNQICQYLIIYLEEFYDLSTYNYYEQIDVTNTNKCKLMYNGFVFENFSDSFLERYRQDYIDINYLTPNPNILSRDIFDPNLEDSVNSKLQSILKLSSINLFNIAKKIGVPMSGIYNIYVYGSYYFGTVNDTSDIDIIIVAQNAEPLTIIKEDNVEYYIYNPDEFEKQLNDVTGSAFVEDYVPTDRVWQVYNTQSYDFKALERIKFNYVLDKQKIKTKQKERGDFHLNLAQKSFENREFERYQKALWSVIRGYEMSIDLIKNGKILDIQQSNDNLEEIRNSTFNNWQEVLAYFQPKINNVYQEMLSL
jgi:predicted nucleotidyltransferase